MPGYSWITLDTALAQLGQRLNDPNFVFWSEPELALYIQQSLRMFNALTFQQKTNFTYNSPNVWNSLGSLAGSPRARTLTDTYCYAIMELMLLEPATGGTWTGTTQFNINDLAQALQTRRDEMIQVSNCNLTLLPGIPAVPNTRRTLVPDYVIDIPRIRWGTGTPTVLGPALEHDQTSEFDPATSDWFNLCPTPTTYCWSPCAAGDVFSAMTVSQPDAKLFLSFFNSSLVQIQTIDLDTVGSTVTAPAGSATFMISANNATFGGTYSFEYSLNSVTGYSFTVVPNDIYYETDFSTSPVSDFNFTPFGAVVPGSQFNMEFVTLPQYFTLTFYDSSKAVISTTVIVGGTTYIAPSNGAFWSLTYSPPNTPNTLSALSFFVSIPTSGAAGTAVTLYRDDTVALEFYESPLYQLAPGTPQTYQMSSEPPLSFDVDIPPDQPGTYELIILKSGVAFAPPADTLLGIPDDFVWVLIWGAMADLLGRESEATDRQRSAYCLKRYQDGLVLLQKTPWIMLGSVNGVACTTDSIFATDRYMPEWDSTPATFGPCIVTGGIDFLGAPINSGIGLAVLGNMPVPTSGGQFLQVSRSDYDIILDLAQCMAAFKQGGAEFEQALELEKRAIQACAAENSRLRSFGAFSDILVQRGQDQERNLNRYNSKGK